jgi:hypothetical protein
MPLDYSLATDTLNIPCFTGGKVDLTLNAGASHGFDGYRIFMSYSGTYPGIQLTGCTLPLNWDALFDFVLYNPGFPGATGFLGQLDSEGRAYASVSLPADPQQNWIGLTLYFAFGTTPAGHMMPFKGVSNPVHIKYIP